MTVAQGDGQSQVQEDATWRMYLGFAREFFTALERGLGAEAGVSVADLELLEPLLAAGEPGLRAKDLAAAAEWQDSLVTRSRDRQDARGTVVGLTDAGAAAARVAQGTRRTLVRDLLIGPLDDDQVRSLEDISARVRARVAEAGLAR
jgi:hypothetical protein